MPQYSEHEFLCLAPTGFEAYDFVFALIAQKDGEYFPVGSACLIGPGFLVTAKHILEYMHKRIAGLKPDERSPDVMESLEGPDYNLLPAHRLGLDALQYLPDGQIRRFSVAGYIQIGYKYTDLMVLKLQPDSVSPLKGPIEWKFPVMDLVPPKAGREIHGYGFPDDPANNFTTEDPWLKNHFLYQSLGEVETVNLHDNLRNFQTTMRTTSGMSGGPVFVSRDGEDRFCGVISRGGAATWSFVAPLWQIGYAATNALPGLPERNGKLIFADLMLKGTIPTIGGEHFTVYENSNNELRVSFVDRPFLENGY